MNESAEASGAMNHEGTKGTAEPAQAASAMRFWRGIFSESDGTPSFSRLATAVVVAFAVGWTTELVSHNHALPDFAGLSCFIGTLYGVNRLSAALSRDAR